MRRLVVRVLLVLLLLSAGGVVGADHAAAEGTVVSQFSLVALIEAHGVRVAGRRAVIVGRSAVVGRPVASLLLARECPPACLSLCPASCFASPPPLQSAASGSPSDSANPADAVGSVLVDISIDQGGCFETSRPTTWKEPIYVEEGVTHFCVTNMPGAVPQTSSQAICAAILPWVNKLASGSWRDNAALVKGINIEGGTIVHPALQGMKL